MSTPDVHEQPRHWTVNGYAYAQHVANRDAIRGAIARRRGASFYVTVRDAGRTGFLLGPYASRLDACARVDYGRELAVRATPDAHFYSYGVSSVQAGAEQPRPIFKDREREAA